jgi:hypothetical protein
MKTKMILAILGIALVSAALVGVSAAQFAGTRNQTAAYPTNPNCVNAATGECIYVNNGTCTNTYCNETSTRANCTGICTVTNCNNTCTNTNGSQTHAGYCYNSTNTGVQNQNQYCNGYSYGCTEQNQNTYGCGVGMMGQTGYGFGRCR